MSKPEESLILDRGNDLRANIEIYDNKRNIESQTRTKWFETSMLPVIRDKFNHINFRNLSKYGINEYFFFHIQRNIDIFPSSWRQWLGCCCCCGCCAEPFYCGKCSSDIIERIPCLFEFFLKKDTCYAISCHQLTNDEMLDSVQKILDELINESEYKLKSFRGKEAIWILW